MEIKWNLIIMDTLETQSFVLCREGYPLLEPMELISYRVNDLKGTLRLSFVEIFAQSVLSSSSTAL